MITHINNMIKHQPHKCYFEYGYFIIFAENLNAGFTYLQQQDQTEFVKVFLYHF